MTDATAFTASPSRFQRLFGAEPAFAAGGLLITLSLAVTIAASAIDQRLFEGNDVWLKPIKFQIALAVYLLSLAFFARFMPDGMTRRWPWRIYAAVVMIAIFVELAWIGGSAAQGIASHFNTSTPAMARLYEIMGMLAFTLTSPSLVMGIVIWRNRWAGISPALRLSIALGLVLTFVLTMIIAPTLAQRTGHFVGTPVTGAAVPFFGWSREVGDLRMPHFLATHAMHFVPIAGLIAVTFFAESTARWLVWAAAGLFAAVVALFFWLALSGLPAIPVV